MLIHLKNDQLVLFREIQDIPVWQKTAPDFLDLRHLPLLAYFACTEVILLGEQKFGNSCRLL